MAALQGKFYAHTAVDKDLKHCPPPQKITGQPPSTAPVRLGPGSNRTLASRTDVVVCEPPRRLGAAPSDAAPRKREARPAPRLRERALGDVEAHDLVAPRREPVRVVARAAARVEDGALSLIHI